MYSEQPPPCPHPGEPLIIEKRLPPVCLPRQGIWKYLFRINSLLGCLVIVERCPGPPPKPQAVIYEKYLPPPPRARQVIVQREACPSTVCGPQQGSCRRVVRQVAQQCTPCNPAQPAVVCTQQNQQTITPGQSQVVQQLVPVFAERQVNFQSSYTILFSHAHSHPLHLISLRIACLITPMYEQVMNI